MKSHSLLLSFSCVAPILPQCLAADFHLSDGSRTDLWNITASRRLLPESTSDGEGPFAFLLCKSASPAAASARASPSSASQRSLSLIVSIPKSFTAMSTGSRWGVARSYATAHFVKVIHEISKKRGNNIHHEISKRQIFQ